MTTLIAYATRKGASRRTAELLATALQTADGRTCTVIDAGRVGRTAIEMADAVSIGSSIAIGRWKGSARRLLGRAAKVLR